MSSIVVLLLLLVCTIVRGQENVQLRVPLSLEECYRDPELLERDNQMPMTIHTLIDLIRKVENSDGFNMDMRQLSVSLLHRFRMDGIVRAPGVSVSPSVLPFSPADFQFSKHKVLLSRLIPGNALQFPNNTLRAIERCTLHFMLSSSIDKRVRNDEAQRCSQLAQFRAMRIPRSASPPTTKGSNFLGDVEFLKTMQSQERSRPSGKMSMVDHDEIYPDDDGTYDAEHAFATDLGLVDIANDAVSQCPVENGVIWTPWGAVNAGSLLAGIAAGLQPQKVQLRTLLALASRSVGNGYKGSDISVDNKWAATLAGDLAEAALLQATITPVRVGASGAWNSTTESRWYFLTQRERLEMTDAEIRGGLDGLIIASKIDEWKNKASSMKLSQLLDMYYSQRGVLDSGIRACDRRLLFTTVAPPEQLKTQAIAFANVLYREMRLRVTLYPNATREFATQAVDALQVYIPQSLNDLSCEATAAKPNDPTVWKTSTDLYVYIDTAWPYRDISPILSWIWPNIDISETESRVTLLNAADCKIIVNTTRSLSDLYLWNITSHQKYPQGLNLPNVLKSIQNLTMSLMESERTQQSGGGRSLVAIVVVQNGDVSDTDANIAIQQTQYLREQVPDLRILFMAAGAIKRFSRYVKEENKDLFPVKISDNVAAEANPVIERIREIPRRIINPRCGSNWQTQDSGQSTMTQAVSPGSVNYYRLHPNYFFSAGTNRKLRVQGKGGLSLSVCSSRQVEMPRSNATKTGDVDCRQILSDAFEVDLNNVCSDHSVIHSCPPLYLSVEVKGGTSSNPIRCSEASCLYPDQVSFSIQTENLGCFSGTARLMGSLAIVAALTCVLRLVH